MVTVEPAAERGALIVNDVLAAPPGRAARGSPTADAGRAVSRARLLGHARHLDSGGERGVAEPGVSGPRGRAGAEEPKLIRTLRGIGHVLRAPRR